MTNNSAFSDMFKNNPFSDMLKNNPMDFNQLFSGQRRNIEAFSAANQVVVESAQAISRRQAEIARQNVEQSLKASKDLMSGGTPEVSMSKNADLAKSFYENALSNLREMTEMLTKSGFEAFDILNKRAAENFAEASKTAAPAKKKA